MSRPKAKLKERRNVNGERYFVFDEEVTPGVVTDFEDWGFEPNTAYFLAWCLKNRREIEEKLRAPH